MADAAYIANDNTVVLDGLRDVDDAYINDATVAVEDVIDADGATVAGISLPLSMPYVTDSNGKYRATLQDTAEFVADAPYTAIVTVDGAGL